MHKTLAKKTDFIRNRLTQSTSFGRDRFTLGKQDLKKLTGGRLYRNMLTLFAYPPVYPTKPTAPELLFCFYKLLSNPPYSP